MSNTCYDRRRTSRVRAASLPSPPTQLEASVGIEYSMLEVTTPPDSRYDTPAGNPTVRMYSDVVRALASMNGYQSPAPRGATVDPPSSRPISLEYPGGLNAPEAVQAYIPGMLGNSIPVKINSPRSTSVDATDTDFPQSPALCKAKIEGNESGGWTTVVRRNSHRREKVSNPKRSELRPEQAKGVRTAEKRLITEARQHYEARLPAVTTESGTSKRIGGKGRAEKLQERPTQSKTDKKRNKKKTKKGYIKDPKGNIDLVSIMVNEAESPSTKRRKREIIPKAMQPVDLIHPKSYIGLALKRLEKRKKRAKMDRSDTLSEADSSNSETPSSSSSSSSDSKSSTISDDSSDSSSDCSSSESNSDNSTTTIQDSSIDDESSDDSSDSNLSDREKCQRKRPRGKQTRKHRKKHKKHNTRRKTLLKPIPPKEYDGAADSKAFHRFMMEGTAYVKDGHVSPKKRVFILSRYLTGKAYGFYMHEVAGNPYRWRLVEFFTELFNYCFPVNYRMIQRMRLQSCYQDNKTVKEYVCELNEIWDMIGETDEWNKVHKLWSGLRTEIQGAFSEEELNPEVTSLENIIAKAEVVEIALSIDREKDPYRPRKPHEPVVPDKRTNKKFGIPRLSKREYDRHKAKGLCFLCHQARHISRNCPNRNDISSGSAGKPLGISSFGIGIDFGDVERQRELARYSREGLDISVNVITLEGLNSIIHASEAECTDLLLEDDGLSDIADLLPICGDNNSDCNSESAEERTDAGDPRVDNAKPSRRHDGLLTPSIATGRPKNSVKFAREMRDRFVLDPGERKNGGVNHPTRPHIESDPKALTDYFEDLGIDDIKNLKGTGFGEDDLQVSSGHSAPFVSGAHISRPYPQHRRQKFKPHHQSPQQLRRHRNARQPRLSSPNPCNCQHPSLTIPIRNNRLSASQHPHQSPRAPQVRPEPLRNTIQCFHRHTAGHTIKPCCLHFPVPNPFHPRPTRRSSPRQNNAQRNIEKHHSDFYSVRAPFESREGDKQTFTHREQVRSYFRYDATLRCGSDDDPYTPLGYRQFREAYAREATSGSRFAHCDEDGRVKTIRTGHSPAEEEALKRVHCRKERNEKQSNAHGVLEDRSREPLFHSHPYSCPARGRGRHLSHDTCFDMRRLSLVRADPSIVVPRKKSPCPSMRGCCGKY